MLSLDPIRPYLPFVYAGVAVVLFGSGYVTGCVRKGQGVATELATKDAALSAAATALRTSRDALRQQNAEHERALQAEQAMRAAEVEAGEIAAESKRRAAERAERFRVQLAEARRRRPDCDALMRESLEARCVISPR